MFQILFKKGNTLCDNGEGQIKLNILGNHRVIWLFKLYNKKYFRK